MSIGLCTCRDPGLRCESNQSRSRQWIERIADLETSLNAKLEIGNRQLAIYYLFENWKRLRAPFCPYFLRSLMRGSRVINPACFRVGRRSPLYSINARVMP